MLGRHLQEIPRRVDVGFASPLRLGNYHYLPHPFLLLCLVVLELILDCMKGRGGKEERTSVGFL